ncbi:MAG: hypothetical protein WCG48_01885 [Candidatus Berkelbacteria bacterium]
MKNLISISTGLVYRVSEDKNVQIKTIGKFKPSGIELVLPFPETLFDFEPDEESLEIIRGLDFFTIHAPSGRGLKYCDNVETQKILAKLSYLSRELDVKNVTFHIENIESYDIFRQCDFKVSIENADHRKSFGQTPAEMEKILSAHPNLFFTFDFAHAMIVNPTYVSDFLKMKSRFSEIHMSVCSEELKEHHFIHLKHKDTFAEVIKQLPQNVPFVIESAAMKAGEINYVVEEIKYLRSI